MRKRNHLSTSGFLTTAKSGYPIFVVGQRHAQPSVIKAADLRMLDKMDYCEPNAREITAMVMDVLPHLYTKGQSRKNIH